MLKQMKTLTINDATYEVVDDYARKHSSGIGSSSSQLNNNFIFRGITFDDVELNTLFNFPNGIEYRGQVVRTISAIPSEDHCTFSTAIKKGDVFVKSNAHILTSESPYLIIADKKDYVIDVVNFENIKTYTFTEDGYMYTCFNYTTVQSGEFFYIKTPGTNEPYILYEDMVEIYKNDVSYGDAAMYAIMSGRQIFIKVPNTDNGNYTAIYSPVYMYQLPNYMNNYLYLFYLKDGWDENGMPMYGQLKLNLSHTYNQSPLL